MYSTTAQKATTSGNIARLNDRDNLSFHSLDAESISDALRRTMRHITEATLTSARPTVLNIDIVDDIMDDIDEDIVEDIIDDSIVEQSSLNHVPFDSSLPYYDFSAGSMYHHKV